LVRRGLPLSAIGAVVLGTEEAVQATVPIGLARTTLQMAMQVALGKAVPALLVSSRAVALTEGALQGMWLSKLKAALAAVLLLSIAGAGASLVWQRLSGVGSSEAQSLRLANREAGGRPEAEIVQPGFDRYGDPLPADAVTRLGTSRLWRG